MESRNQVLTTLYSIVKEQPQPSEYAIRPRELILRLMLDWGPIHDRLKEMEVDGLVRLEQQDTLIIHLTHLGLEAALQLEQHSSTLSQ